LFLDRRLLESGDRGDWESGTRILMNRSVDAAVIENSADVILGQGLAYDRCQIGIVSRIDPAAHYGRYHITNPEQVFNVLRSQVDVVLQDGVAVLNAADPMVVEMAPLSDGEVMFFAADPTLDVIEEHRAHGGRAVFIRENEVILATGDEETSLAPLDSIAFLGGTPTAMRVENMLAAIAAAWALGIASHVMRTGLETFSPEPAI
jgi:cyanophycin synthetase